MEKTITLRIPEEMKSALDRICEEEGKNMSVIVRDYLERLISVHKFKSLRDKTLPYAEKQNIFSDEDVFSKIVS
jgi:Arc/MetJ-type ribon-helix-helix transcriptional regulator